MFSSKLPLALISVQIIQGCSLSALAQSDAWSSAMNAGQALYAKKDYAGAAKEFEVAAQTLDDKYAGTILILADCYFLQHEYDKAHPLYVQGLVILRKPDRKRTPLTIAIEMKAIKNLGSIYFQQGQFEQEENLANRALEISDKSEDPSVADSLKHLALLYAKRQKFAEAEPLLKRALEIQEISLGPNKPQLAETLSMLADMCRAQAKPLEAIPYEKRAAEIKARAKAMSK